MKNFGVEVRGMRDVENLLEDAVILLRPRSVVLADLIEEILEHLNPPDDENKTLHQEVRDELFIDTNGAKY